MRQLQIIWIFHLFISIFGLSSCSPDKAAPPKDVLVVRADWPHSKETGPGKAMSVSAPIQFRVVSGAKSPAEVLLSAETLCSMTNGVSLSEQVKMPLSGQQAILSFLPKDLWSADSGSMKEITECAVELKFQNALGSWDVHSAVRFRPLVNGEGWRADWSPAKATDTQGPLQIKFEEVLETEVKWLADQNGEILTYCDLDKDLPALPNETPFFMHSLKRLPLSAPHQVCRLTLRSPLSETLAISPLFHLRHNSVPTAQILIEGQANLIERMETPSQRPLGRWKIENPSLTDAVNFRFSDAELVGKIRVVVNNYYQYIPFHYQFAASTDLEVTRSGEFWSFRLAPGQKGEIQFFSTSIVDCKTGYRVREKFGLEFSLVAETLKVEHMVPTTLGGQKITQIDSVSLPKTRLFDHKRLESFLFKQQKLAATHLNCRLRPQRGL